MKPLLSFDPSDTTEQIPTKAQALTEQRTFLSSPEYPTDKARHKRVKLNGLPPNPEGPFHEHHRSILMNIFLNDNSESSTTEFASSLLTNDIDVDLVLDEQGHTALHWAAAMGKVPIVKMLMEKGASMYRTNYDGETPLMRAVMVTCCSDSRCFHELAEIMKETIPVVDDQGRTVLHHIALTAGINGYTEAAIQYMKILLKLIPKKSQSRQVLEAKDRVFSESALAIAMRVECQEIVDLLIKHGALDPSILRKEPNIYIEYSPVEYKPNPKGRDLIQSVQLVVDKIEEDYQEQLKRKDKEIFKKDKELMLAHDELQEAQRRLELPVSLQLVEARKRIRELEEKTAHPESKQRAFEEEKEEKEEESAMSDTTHIAIQSLQQQLDSSRATTEQLKLELSTIKDSFGEREMEYKRLIATCCNIPIEKVDMLIKPLTMAIENNPPDLDMAKMVGLMGQLDRRGSIQNSTNMTSDLPNLSPNF